MKWSIFAAVVLCFVFGLPFHDYDTEKLLPLQTLQVISEKSGIRLLSEAGEGTGASWDEAVEDLKRKASGHVFFDTVEHVVFCGRGLEKEVLFSEQLRPAAQVYYAEKPLEQENLAEYLSAHPAPMTLADLKAYFTDKVPRRE